MALTRRKALQRSIVLASAYAGMAFGHGGHGAASDNAHVSSTILKPRGLRRGMTVGLVSPASNTLENRDIQFAVDVIRSLGFAVRTSPNLFERNQYLAGTDAQRASDLNAFFADDGIDAIFCLRGGYGTLRLLPYLDYDAIAANPKVLMGYSDITSLMNAIHRKTGLICYHGPIASQNLSEYTLAEFRKVMMEAAGPVDIARAPPCADCREGYVDRDNRLTTITGGVAEGRLIGGNLTVLTSMLGTPYQPDFAGALLFLEDVGEAPYRVDRMLTQLLLAGVLEQCEGIALGRFTEAEAAGNSFSIEEVLFDRLQPLGIPVLRGLMIGHIENQTVVPIGLRGRLDADRQKLSLLEAPVA